MSKRLILLLVFCVHLTTSAAVLAKRGTAEAKEKPDVKIDFKKIILEWLNDERLNFAKEHNIGNMHELNYDSGLEKIAEEMAASCELKPGSYIFISSENMHKKSKELLHPLQTQYANVKLLKPCHKRGLNDSITLLGPSNEKFSDKLFKFGPLGSHCSHGTADNKLCKAGPKSGSNSQLNFWIFAVFAAFVMIFY